MPVLTLLLDLGLFVPSVKAVHAVKAGPREVHGLHIRGLAHLRSISEADCYTEITSLLAITTERTRDILIEVSSHNRRYNHHTWEERFPECVGSASEDTAGEQMEPLPAGNHKRTISPSAEHGEQKKSRR